jgi:hypothetical protein
MRSRSRSAPSEQRRLVRRPTAAVGSGVGGGSGGGRDGLGCGHGEIRRDVLGLERRGRPMAMSPRSAPNSKASCGTCCATFRPAASRLRGNSTARARTTCWSSLRQGTWTGPPALASRRARDGWPRRLLARTGPNALRSALRAEERSDCTTSPADNRRRPTPRGHKPRGVSLSRVHVSARQRVGCVRGGEVGARWAPRCARAGLTGREPKRGRIALSL